MLCCVQRTKDPVIAKYLQRIRNKLLTAAAS